MMKRVTVQMIADSCGLSKSTVAYVLREPVTCRATEKTRQLVQETARLLGYHRNFAARALSTSRYQAIGILFPTVRGYYGELMLALDAVMRRRGYHGICSFWENGTFQESLESLCRQGIDGLITVHYAPVLREAGKPVVIYGNSVSDFDCICPDKDLYMKQAIDYLVSRGYRSVGYIGSSRDLRYGAMLKELSVRGLPVRRSWIREIRLADVQSGYEAALGLFAEDDLPEVLLVHSDLVARGVYRAAAGRIRIPEDLAVLSYDNLESSVYMTPALSTFDPGYPESAGMLMEMMLSRIEHPEMPFRNLKIAMKLMERESVPDRLCRPDGETEDPAAAGGNL